MAFNINHGTLIFNQLVHLLHEQSRLFLLGHFNLNGLPIKAPPRSSQQAYPLVQTA